LIVDRRFGMQALFVRSGNQSSAECSMLVIAGGGNRCYWRGGFYETIAPLPGGIRAAYELGVKDGNAFAAALGK
jgi:hypothetical protein